MCKLLTRSDASIVSSVLPESLISRMPNLHVALAIYVASVLSTELDLAHSPNLITISSYVLLGHYPWTPYPVASGKEALQADYYSMRYESATQLMSFVKDTS